MTMSRIFVYPYKMGSRSAKALSEALSAKQIKLSGSNFRESPNKTVINWGSTSCPYECMNTPAEVKDASDKLVAFLAMDDADVSVPDFTNSSETASDWLREGHTVVVRHSLTGSSGHGIELISDPSVEMPEAPLYTKYVKKTDEYRVHVFNGKVIDVQKKMRKNDVPAEEVNWQIRNLAGGFIFGREGIDTPAACTEEAIKAVHSLGLLFGAVDVGYHSEFGAKVYEVNTAPGLEGSTVTSYANAFKEYLNV